MSLAPYIYSGYGVYYHFIIQWNLSVTTTSTMKFNTYDLFSNVF